MSLAPLRLCCQWPACLLHNRPLAQVSFDFIWKSRLSRIYVVSQNQTVCYFCSLVLFALPSPLFVSTFAHTAGGNSHVLRDNPFTCLYYYQFYTVTRKCPFFNFCSIWSQKLFIFFMLLWVFVRSFVSLLTRVHIIFHAQRTIDNTQPKPKLFLNCFEDAALCVRSEKNAYPDKGWKRLLRWLWYSSHEWCVGFVQGLYKGLTLVTVKTF